MGDIREKLQGRWAKLGTNFKVGGQYKGQSLMCGGDVAEKLQGRGDIMARHQVNWIILGITSG